MIKTSDLRPDSAFLSSVGAARKEFAKGNDWEGEQKYACRMVVSPEEIFQNPDWLRFMLYRLFEYEKDMIYKAVVFSDGIWTSIRSQFTSRNPMEFVSMGLEFAVKVDAVVSDRKVYIPIYAESQMPRDVYKCTWCGGYTKNDKRGHCSGCGGPRNEDYVSEMWSMP